MKIQLNAAARLMETAGRMPPRPPRGNSGGLNRPTKKPVKDSGGSSVPPKVKK